MWISLLVIVTSMICGYYNHGVIQDMWIATYQSCIHNASQLILLWWITDGMIMMDRWQHDSHHRVTQSVVHDAIMISQIASLIYMSNTIMIHSIQMVFNHGTVVNRTSCDIRDRITYGTWLMEHRSCYSDMWWTYLDHARYGTWFVPLMIHKLDIVLSMV